MLYIEFCVRTLLYWMKRIFESKCETKKMKTWIILDWFLGLGLGPPHHLQLEREMCIIRWVNKMREMREREKERKR